MNNEQDAKQTIIDADVEINGVLKVGGNKSVIIRGLIVGEIESNGEITIESGGVIKGSIVTKDLIVSGRVETDKEISVLGLLTVRKGGILIASTISYGDLNHESGARMYGQLEPSEPMEEARTQPQGKLGASLANILTPIIQNPRSMESSKLPFRQDVVSAASVMSLDKRQDNRQDSRQDTRQLRDLEQA